MSILWRRSSSKKGAALMSVMCMMTFIIILGTVALTVTDAAHQNVVYQNKIQQAYYTAKSAADATKDYISSIGGPNQTGSAELSKKLYEISQNVDTGAYIEGAWYDSTLGKYKVDIYPTKNPNCFKIIAESEYQGITGKTAILVGPSSGGVGFDDALVGKGSAKANGSPQIGGGMTLNQSILDKNSNGDIYFGGNINNTGDIDLSEHGHAYTTEEFEKKYKDSFSVISGEGNLSIGNAYTIVDINGNNDGVDVWQYYSYLVCKKNFKIKNWNDSSESKRHNVGGKTVGNNAVLVGGDFTLESVSYATFSAPVYVGGNFNIDGGTPTIVFKEPVYVEGNAKVKGGVVFEKGLYVKGTANTHEAGGANGDVYDGSAYTTAFDEYKTKLEEKIKIPQEKIDSYGDYPFRDDEKKEMGIGVSEDSVKNYRIGHKQEGGKWMPDFKYTQNGVETAPALVNVADGEYDITISESGILSEFDLRNTKNGGTRVFFDTSNGSSYKNIYIRIKTNMTEKDYVNKCKFIVKGKGNVYLYLDGDNCWTSDECVMTTEDPTDPDSTQPRLFIVSNSKNPSTYVSLGATITAEQTMMKAYIYAPGVNVKFSGSTGLYGFIIGNTVDMSSGSGQSIKYIPPRDADGNILGLDSNAASKTYETKLRWRGN